jgi:hypothetical protein
VCAQLDILSTRILQNQMSDIFVYTFKLSHIHSRAETESTASSNFHRLRQFLANVRKPDTLLPPKTSPELFERAAKSVHICTHARTHSHAHARKHTNNTQQTLMALAIGTEFANMVRSMEEEASSSVPADGEAETGLFENALMGPREGPVGVRIACGFRRAGGDLFLLNSTRCATWRRSTST